VRGFSLLEMMIVGVLACASVPVFSGYFAREKKLAAEMTLLKVAASLEEYFVKNNSYKGANLSDLGLAGVDGAYQFEIVSATESEFALNAKSVKSVACGTLTLDSTGKRNSCWD
jgi:type IV pilus assembly protein PilE